ncbi:hypothetical protein CEXT_449311 [Caerostris extrusa]|uniref:Uncharacterized protein n=1 Tax=Caerostris extrusa TaxID=172846 RepID=A0AAV4UXN8_CAEEX|nr:hypothetical protein CEXT_449311 [Caerostris extrusa]
MREDHPKALLVAVSWINMMDEVSDVLLRSCTSSLLSTLKTFLRLLSRCLEFCFTSSTGVIEGAIEDYHKKGCLPTRTEKRKKKKEKGKLEKISIAKEKPEFLSEDRYEGGSPEGVVGRRVLDKHDGWSQRCSPSILHLHSSFRTPRHSSASCPDV